jgi:Enhancer of polycomb-like
MRVRFETPESAAEIEDQLIRRTLPRVGTGMEAEEEEEEHIKKVLQTSAVRAVADIPTPQVTHVSDYATLHADDFSAPPSYVRIPRQSVLDEFRQVHYDMDDRDFDWLAGHNEKVASSNAPPLSEDQFEVLVDRFEKKTGTALALAPLSDVLPTLSTFGAVHASGPIDLNIAMVHARGAYLHWVKRRNGRGRPLLRQFWPVPLHDDPSPLVAFRAIHKPQRRKPTRRNDKQALGRIRTMRQELERARIMLELCKRREQLKKKYIDVLKQVFEQRCIDARNPAPRVPLRDMMTSRQMRTAAAAAAAAASAAAAAAASSYDYASSGDEDDDGSSASSSSAAAAAADATDDGQQASSLALPTAASSIVSPSSVYDPFAPDHLGHVILLGSGMTPFRGRARIGRGGRVLFDRYRNVLPAEIPAELVAITHRSRRRAHRHQHSRRRRHRGHENASENAMVDDDDKDENDEGRDDRVLLEHRRDPINRHYLTPSPALPFFPSRVEDDSGSSSASDDDNDNDSDSGDAIAQHKMPSIAHLSHVHHAFPHLVKPPFL